MHYLPPALTGNNKSFPHHEPCRGHDGGPRPPLSVEREIDGGQSSPAGGMMALVESCLRILSSPLDGGLISRAPKGDGGLISRACLRIQFTYWVGALLNIPKPPPRSNGQSRRMRKHARLLRPPSKENLRQRTSS